MTPEARAREQIDNRLRQSGWTIQDLKQLNLTVASGVAVREFPTNTVRWIMHFSLRECQLVL